MKSIKKRLESEKTILTIMSNMAHAASIIVITRYKIILRRALHTTYVILQNTIKNSLKLIEKHKL